MTVEYKRELQKLLRELFHFDSADLDFGIYRIMNQKRDMIEHFIQEDLIETIDKEYEILLSEEKSKINEDLNELRNEIENNIGKNAFHNNDEIKLEFVELPIVKKYQNKKLLIDKQIKIDNEVAEIFSHLYHFFSRYYSDGDFISKRRYSKKQKYIVPYNGEEVKLYWANNDQHYIKSTEWFTKYSFKTTKQKVNFLIRQAKDELGNIKAEEQRFFVLEDDFLELNDNVVNIYFSYRGLTTEELKKYGKSVKQEKLNDVYIEQILQKISKKYSEKIKITKKQLEEHLFKYTKRNTSDYFIHKNLKEFLLSELDFYIKNEILKLNFDGGDLNNSLTKANVIKKISEKIIAFLAQIEAFQKKLWEKKKFVINTNYVISLDKLAEYTNDSFLEDIIIPNLLNNKDQLNEWQKFFKKEIKNSRDFLKSQEKLIGKDWYKLPIDTRYFDNDFKWLIIENITSKKCLDKILDGTLIKSDNWQALNLIKKKYAENIHTIYIDPPFNLGSNPGYLYKVDYKDSTWITMLEDRIMLGKELMKGDGSIFIRCDYNGNMYVRHIMDRIFGQENIRNELQVSRISKQDPNIKKFNVSTDSLFFYSKNANVKFFPIFIKLRNPKPGRWHAMDSQGQGSSSFIFNYEFSPPKGRHWTYGQEKIRELEKDGKIRIRCRNCGYIHNSGEWKGCSNCNNKIDVTIQYFLPPTEFKQVDSNWTDIPGYTSVWDFQTENSEKLLHRVICSSTEKGDLVCDFFLGSGTTIAVSQKLQRKWLGVEIGNHFYTHIIPRLKHVLFYDSTQISKLDDVKDIYNNESAGGFFKYITLEQYEDSLNNIEFVEKKGVQKTLDTFDDYFLYYILDYETESISTELSLKTLADPFNYKLKISKDNELIT